MSFFSGIISAEHTFAAWAEKQLAKLYTSAPAIEKIASTVLTYVGPVLKIVVTAEAGAPAGAIVSNVIEQAQSDLVVAGSLIYDFGATPSAATLIGSVASNLNGLLTAGHITNATSVANVTTAVNNLNALTQAIVPAA